MDVYSPLPSLATVSYLRFDGLLLLKLCDAYHSLVYSSLLGVSQRSRAVAPVMTTIDHCVLPYTASGFLSVPCLVLLMYLSAIFSAQVLDLLTISDTTSSSSFTQAMLRDSVNATATAGNIVHFLGDSFTEQVANYMAVDNTASEKKVPIGWPIGVSLGSLAIVGAAVWLGFYVVHQRRQNRLQQVRCVTFDL